MGLIKKVIGPLSKYDKTIPYTYKAKVQVIEGDDSLINHFFSDTICALIEYLDEKNINPVEAELFGCCRGKEIPIDKKYCMNKDGDWLYRPELCHSLEERYKKTMEEQYKGHTELEECSFGDRDRKADGPY